MDLRTSILLSLGVGRALVQAGGEAGPCTVVQTPWWQRPRAACGAQSVAHVSDTGAAGMLCAAIGPAPYVRLGHPEKWLLYRCGRGRKWPVEVGFRYEGGRLSLENHGEAMAFS